jgi:hypothetical protein
MIMEAQIWKIQWGEGMSVGIPEIDDDHRSHREGRYEVRGILP